MCRNDQNVSSSEIKRKRLGLVGGAFCVISKMTKQNDSFHSFSVDKQVCFKDCLRVMANFLGFFFLFRWRAFTFDGLPAASLLLEVVCPKT